MKKKIISLCLVVCLLATAIAGTVAYFTDTEEANNVFTVGKVDVELYESYYHRESAYMENVPESAKKTGEISNEDIIASAEKYDEYLEAQTIMPGIHINKMPYVKNTGNTDAYVRIRVMVPKEMDEDFLMSSVYCTSALTSGEFTRKPTYIAGEKTATGVVEGEYAVYEFVRVEALEPGKMTYWNVWNTIALDTTVTNQDLETLINDGVIDDLTFGVKVEVDAIQADSFANADAAWTAFDAQKTNSVSTEAYSANAKDGYVTEDIA